MAIIKNRDEFMSRINQMIGERNDDEALSFLSDLSDTYDSLSQTDIPDIDAINASWEEKYNNLDNEWRNKYKERFMNKPINEEDIGVDRTNGNPDNIESFEELFT